MKAVTFAPGLVRESESSAPEKIRSIAKTRVQLDLSPRAMKVLTDLKETTDVGTYAEVIKNALKVYDGLLTEVDQGREFYTKDENGNFVPFRIFL